MNNNTHMHVRVLVTSVVRDYFAARPDDLLELDFSSEKVFIAAFLFIESTNHRIATETSMSTTTTCPYLILTSFGMYFFL